MIAPNKQPAADAPKKKDGQEQSRPTTPNSIISDATTTKLPSLAMERIKIQNRSALDRMASMQQRYQQHQEMINSNAELNRRTSNGSQFDDINVSLWVLLIIFIM